MQTSQLGIKQYGNRLNIQLNGCYIYRMEISSKGIYYPRPILTAILSTIKQMQSEQAGIANTSVRNYLHSIATLELYIFHLFPYYLIPNLFAYFFTFDPYSLFNNYLLQFLKSFLVSVVFHVYLVCCILASKVWQFNRCQLSA